ncbi:MAG: hypothetical protein R3E90_10105 [Marinicella sp.]
MEYVIFTILMVVILSFMFYGQIFLYINKYNNLKAIRIGSRTSQEAKQFYMAYMGIYQTGEQPHIQARLNDIEFEPTIKPSNEEFMNFNLSPLAIKNLSLETDHLKFAAKISGQIVHTAIPLKSITLIVGQSGIGFTMK